MSMRMLWFINRTSHTNRPSVKYMSVDHSCFNIFVPQKFLNRSDVITVFEQMLGK